MFDASFTELVLILVIGLLILGPERLPKVAAQIGRWVARARRTAHQLRMQLEREVALDDLKRAQEKKPRPKPPQPAGETGDGSAAGAAKPADSKASSTEPPSSPPDSARPSLGVSDAPPPLGIPDNAHTDRPTLASADSNAGDAPPETEGTPETEGATEDETAVR